MDKQYITPQQLLADAYALAVQVFESGFRPNYIVGVWRGGTPVAIAVHELLLVLGIQSDHTAIRTQSYTGMGKREEVVEVNGLEYLTSRVSSHDTLLLVDDVHDTGLSLQRVISAMQHSCGTNIPDIRIATPYFKPGKNRRGSEPDYYLHRTDAWLVFPHELEGLTVAEMKENKPELSQAISLLERHLKPTSPD